MTMYLIVLICVILLGLSFLFEALTCFVRFRRLEREDGAFGLGWPRAAYHRALQIECAVRLAVGLCFMILGGGQIHEIYVKATWKPTPVVVGGLRNLSHLECLEKGGHEIAGRYAECPNDEYFYGSVGRESEQRFCCGKNVMESSQPERPLSPLHPIPLAQRARYLADLKTGTWKNPAITISADAIEVKGLGRINADELYLTLAGLSRESWPYGRIIAVREIAPNKAGERRFLANRASVYKTLDKLLVPFHRDGKAVVVASPAPIAKPAAALSPVYTADLAKGRWRNPTLVLYHDSVELNGRKYKINELLVQLSLMPAKSWPYGRVVGVRLAPNVHWNRNRFDGIDIELAGSLKNSGIAEVRLDR
ncbi:MAG: hypothetical protein KGO96_14260 [Elusimicrobia bacterium]|nr:hypothetical protein [Elusimicrobiota bacterium]MDE2236371.1 hypothetical protein [Elusimicrobiota bacterium]MDE2427058.1 hypothetical protein [Elusimicrobiota bacterium]